MSDEFTKQNAVDLAYDLLESKGLDDWKVVIETGPQSLDRLGVCEYDFKTIGISDWVFSDLNHEVEDTVRHEVAHAVAGPCGHNLKWKMAAKNLGAKPRACCTDGIPQELRQQIKEKKDKAEAPAAPNYKFKDFEPVTYQIPCEINCVNDEYVAKQGEHFVCSNVDLKHCIAEAVAYCSMRRAVLVINFQKFVTDAIA